MIEKIEEQWIEDTLKQVADSAWSLGLQGASKEELYSDRNNSMTYTKANKLFLSKLQERERQIMSDIPVIVNYGGQLSIFTQQESEEGIEGEAPRDFTWLAVSKAALGKFAELSQKGKQDESHS